MALPVALAAWDFRFGIEATNPIFYLNIAACAMAIGLARMLAPRRHEDATAAGGFWAMVVLAVGTGLHLLGDLTNFPEDGDHVFIHAVLAVALLVFLVAVRRR